MSNQLQARFLVTVVVLLTAAMATRQETAFAADDTISFGAVQKIVTDFLATKPDHQPGDLLSRADVAAVLKELAAAGWVPADQKEILADTLEDDNPLVRNLSTKQGRRFMRKVSGYGQIYDRLDRVSRVSGGERMVRDLVKLPDGEKYAKAKPARGVPDLLDLLPKKGSGQRRSIKDYDKQTKRVYTQADLLNRLKQSHEGPPPAKGQASAKGQPSPAGPPARRARQ